MQRTSKNYVGTFHYESAADMLELERIRKAIKVVNYRLSHFKYGGQGNKRNKRKERALQAMGYKGGYGKESYHQFYVKCAGRLGKNNPNAYKYNSFNRFGAEREEGIAGYVRLEDATRVDAYIYER